jgi:hypothetical protein
MYQCANRVRMKKSKNGLNALIYLFDDIIADRLGYPYEEYTQIIESIDIDEADFIMSATFEIIVEEEEGNISDETTNDFLSAKERFSTFHESFFKKSAE